MIHALLFAATLAQINHRPPVIDEVRGVQGCPTGAIGYVLVIKDGEIVGGDHVRHELHGSALTAWFWSPHGQAVILLDLTPDPTGRITLRAIDGIIQIVHGRYCVFPNPPT